MRLAPLAGPGCDSSTRFGSGPVSHCSRCSQQKSALPELNGGLRLCGGLNGVQGYAMTDDRLQPIDPSTAKEMYLREREQEVSDRTRQAHHYRLKHFVRWCDRESIENLNELSGRNIHEFRLWRRDDGELNAASLRTQLQTSVDPIDSRMISFSRR